MGWSLCQGGNGGGSSGTPYVFSRNNCYIELPVYSDEDLVIEFDFFKFSNSGGHPVIIGDIFSNNGSLLFFTNNSWECYMGSGSHGSWTANYTDVTSVKIEYALGKITIDGTVVHNQAGTRQHQTIKLFGVSYYFNGAIGEVDIYKDGDLYMHLVPMKDGTTGEGYYHDTIGNQDYYAGSTDKTEYIEMEV